MKRGPAAAACVLAAATACLSERPRPAPPVLGIALDSTTIHSKTPNSDVTGSVRVRDATGLDSIWVQVDTVRVGADGLFQTDYSAPFDFPVGAGLSPGTRISLTLQARDLVGFSSELDTFVTVIR